MSLFTSSTGSTSGIGSPVVAPAGKFNAVNKPGESSSLNSIPSISSPSTTTTGTPPGPVCKLAVYRGKPSGPIGA